LRYWKGALEKWKHNRMVDFILFKYQFHIRDLFYPLDFQEVD
jgi:hypothetical protein